MEAMTKAYRIFVVVDLSFNVITTSLITACIMMHRTKLRKSSGKQAILYHYPDVRPLSGTHDHGREYINIIAMTIESCMISAISPIVYLVLYAMNSFVQYPLMVIQNQMQVRDYTTLCYLDFIFSNAGHCVLCIGLENHSRKNVDKTSRC